MRIIFLFAILGLLGNVVIAQQLTLIPQAGGQQFRIIQKSPDPAHSKNYFEATSISLGARLHYNSKNRQGLFIGFHLNEMAMAGMLQRYEIGYQLSGNRMYPGKKKDQEASVSKGLFLQFQPSIGFVIQKLRSGNDTDSSGPVIYNAKSGRINPGILTNLGLTLGRDNRPVLNINLYYIHGFTKIYETSYYSTGYSYTQITRGSSLGLNFGIPFTILNRK